VNIAIVHDYLTQRGGAERVLLSMVNAFPAATLYTSVYDPPGTFPEFRDLELRVLPLNRSRLIRRHHRLALPLLAGAFSRLTVDADVVLCSSSGWAHGVRATGHKIVYCYSPARWLYQTSLYLQRTPAPARVLFAALRPRLLDWDRRAAATAERYLTTSTAVRRRIRDAYGIDADLVPPPPTLTVDGPTAPVPALDGSEFFLLVSRLLPYKNVEAAIEAFRLLPEQRLVIVGSGPEERRLRGVAPPNVLLLGTVPDDALRWLYSRCAAVMAASYEDYGLTPLEAASFGRPAVALRAGGFLDTIVEHETGTFFDRPRPDEIAAAVRRSRARPWSEERLRRHANAYSEDAFVARLRQIVEESAR
jgi:glycosyltransferase involved in cell wall biosynthesis